MISVCGWAVPRKCRAWLCHQCRRQHSGTWSRHHSVDGFGAPRSGEPANPHLQRKRLWTLAEGSPSDSGRGSHLRVQLAMKGDAAAKQAGSMNLAALGIYL